MVREGSKVRALLVEAEETDDTVRTAIETLVQGCKDRTSPNSDVEFPDLERAIDRARKELDGRWTDNDLSDAAAEALYAYSDETIKIASEVGRIAQASQQAAFEAFEPTYEQYEVATKRLEQALQVRERYDQLSKSFFARLTAERKLIERQRATLSGVPVEPALFRET